MFVGNNVEISEEAEEIRELLYDIVKDYPTGVTSDRLESLYNEKYVQAGLGDPLPKNWLSYVEVADEFEVRKMSMLTMVYIVQKNDIGANFMVDITGDLSEDLKIDDLNPASSLTSAPQEIPIGPDTPLQEAQILTIVPSRCLYVHLTSHQEDFEKFNSHLQDFYSSREHQKANNVLENRIYVVKIDDRWKRVLVKASDRISCFLVDEGLIQEVESSSMKVLDASLSLEKFPAFVKCCLYAQNDPTLLTYMPHLPTTTFDHDHQPLALVPRPENYPEHIKVKFMKVDSAQQVYEVEVYDINGKELILPEIPENDAAHSNGDSKTLDTTPTSPRIETPMADNGLMPFQISTMPVKESQVHIISATDPDNINIRLDPMPDYLYAALARDAEESSLKLEPNEIEKGKLYSGLVDGTWERVQTIKMSSINKNSWIVYAVDIGLFAIVKKDEMRKLGDSTVAFDRMLLAKCKLSGIRPSDKTLPPGIWPRGAQLAFQELLYGAITNPVKLIPTSSWLYSDQKEVPSVPIVSAKLLIEGIDLGQKLISLGLANKSA